MSDTVTPDVSILEGLQTVVSRTLARILLHNI